MGLRMLSPGGLIERWAHGVTRWPGRVLVAVGLVFGTAALLAPGLRFDFSPQALFDTFEEDVARNRAFVETFGHAENTLVLLLVAESVLTPEALRAVHDVSERYGSAPWVTRVDSLTATVLPRATPEGLDMRRWGTDAATMPEAVAALRASALARGRLVSADGTLAAVVLQLEEELLAAEQLSPVMRDLRADLAELPTPSGGTWTVAGVPWVRAEVVRRLKLEQVIFLPLTFVCYTIVLFVMFRRWSGVVLPLGVVVVSVAIAAGAMVLANEPLNIINNIVPTLVFIIGISDAIHLLSRYEEEYALRGDRARSVRATVRAMAVACFLTSFTSAVGFLSLLMSQTEILRRFGLVAAFGVLVAYAVTLSLVPAVLSRSGLSTARGRPGSAPVGEGVLHAAATSRLERAVEHLARWSMRHARPVVAGGALLVAACVWAAWEVPVDSAMLEVFSATDDVARTTRLVEERLEGVLPLEVAIMAPAGRRVDEPAVLNAIEEVRRRGAGEDIVTNTASASRLLLDIWALWTDDPARRESTFSSAAQVAQLSSLLQSGSDDPLLDWWTFDGRQARLQFRLADHGGQETLAFGSRVDRWMGESFSELEGYSWHLTGDAWVAAIGLRAFIRDLLASLGTAVVIIFGFMMVTFRSVRLGVLSVPANLLPLLVTLGFMGVTGIELNTTTVILFSVSLGLAVDDTIHVLARYAEALRAGLSGDEAIAVAVRGAGRAIVLTSMLLGVGLLVLTTSTFVPTERFAWLTAMTIAGCLIADLVLLPALLSLWPERSPPADAPSVHQR